VTGTVVTFYSYKGGVGRSFALANIAVLLARWGFRVLTVDWDLEAPGLHAYFAPMLSEPPTQGVVDVVDDFASGVAKPAADYLTPVNVSEQGTVDLLAAGRLAPDYGSRVQAIDWARLYEDGFADLLERHRADWIADYDFVLIDSRTGYADIASMCTAHLPDRLVVVFTANEQSVRGAVDVVHRAGAARDRMPYDRPQLTVLPILSRFDSRVEYQRAETWYRTCTELTAPLFRNWLIKNVSAEQMLRHLTLPYVSYWSFGEQLPVVAERVPSTEQIAFGLETVAAIVAHKFDRTDLLADNRDAYVAAARAPESGFELDVLVSSPRSARAVADALVVELRALDLRAETSLSGDLDSLGMTLDSARHLCLVVDKELSRWQEAEAERFLRRTLTIGSDRRLFPVLTTSVDAAGLPGFVRNLRSIELGGGVGPGDVARVLHDSVSIDRARPTDQQVLRDAGAALRDLSESRLRYTDWYTVERAVETMDEALRAGDTKRLRDMIVELGRTHREQDPENPDDERVALPKRLVSPISTMIGRLDRRLRS
jgi:MinD-like ATPase involved in chromosome partitioning or flagellar assembly